MAAAATALGSRGGADGGVPEAGALAHYALPGEQPVLNILCFSGVGSGSSSLWELMGNAMVMTQFVRLTPDIQSKQGAVWNRVPCYLRDWEMQVHFRIHGQGKKNLNGDGFAIWYTKDRMQPGPVFGSKENFIGLGVFVDTYPNEEKQQEAQKKRYTSGNQRVFPYVLAMVTNGSLVYDHERDGRPTELGGCTAIVRNLEHDTFLVLLDIDGKHEWRDCLDIPGVHLPRGYFFGISSVTGDLSVETPMEPLSGLALFLIIFFSLVAIVFAIVIGVIVYNKWQEQSRKHFY
ncbi:hypothetical protein Chor_002248 [Crotalus horridus]